MPRVNLYRNKFRLEPPWYRVNILKPFWKPAWLSDILWFLSTPLSWLVDPIVLFCYYFYFVVDWSKAYLKVCVDRNHEFVRWLTPTPSSPTDGDFFDLRKTAFIWNQFPIEAVGSLLFQSCEDKKARNWQSLLILCVYRFIFLHKWNADLGLETKRSSILVALLLAVRRPVYIRNSNKISAKNSVYGCSFGESASISE